MRHAPLEWTLEEHRILIPLYKERGGLVETGDAACLFLRPTDEQLERLKAGEPPNGAEDWFAGRNIWSIAWWGRGLASQLKLTRRMLAEVGEGGVFATHQGDQYKEWRPERHGDRGRREPCQQQ